MFSLSFYDPHWIDRTEDVTDLCLHGSVTVTIGAEQLSDTCTASTAALYMMRSLHQGHLLGEYDKLLPCCGHSMWANKGLDEVTIIACPNGSDWEVQLLAESNKVALAFRDGKCIQIPFEDYRQEVFTFADTIEHAYAKALPRVLPEDMHERHGYFAFWNEWNRLRHNGEPVWFCPTASQTVGLSHCKGHGRLNEELCSLCRQTITDTVKLGDKKV